MEDIMKIETGFGKKVLGFILKKVIEKKLDIRFVSFEFGNVYVSSSDDECNLRFDMRIFGELPKADVLDMIQGGKK